MVGHVRKRYPWHDLEKITVRDIVVTYPWAQRYGSRGNANWRTTCLNFCQLCCRTGWMDVIEIFAVPQDLLKL